MAKRVSPIIHVPDVNAAVEWYTSIGFEVRNSYADTDDEETHDGDGTEVGRGALNFALLSYGDTQIMFSDGGAPSAATRREVDLYVYLASTDTVDATYDRLRSNVDVVETPHDTFYGMRELIVRDLNGFWVTFAQPITES